jgi:hypothetical protein
VGLIWWSGIGWYEVNVISLGRYMLLLLHPSDLGSSIVTFAYRNPDIRKHLGVLLVVRLASNVLMCGPPSSKKIS